MNILIKDKNNKDIILDSTKSHLIMMEWEKPYMEACIQKLQPYGDVLEIGFGLGYSASEIQKFPIKSYTVIECDFDTYQRALKWKEKYNSSINVIYSKWENIYQQLPKFNCIFFDDYDIESLEKYKNNPHLPCRNIDFIEKIKNNLKVKSKFSFYCAANKKDIKKYERQWMECLIFYQKKVSFEEYLIDIPTNCNYIIDQTLYCPLIELRQTFNYN